MSCGKLRTYGELVDCLGWYWNDFEDCYRRCCEEGVRVRWKIHEFTKYIAMLWCYVITC